MKRIIVATIFSILALTLSACGTAAASGQSNSTGGSPGTYAGASNSAGSAPINGTPTDGLTALQLAAGILKLDGTSNAITAQEAAKLLPLWQSLQQTESSATPSGGFGTPGARPNAAMMQQVSAQFAAIQSAMTPEQIQAITAMNLSRQDIFAAFQQAGIAVAGPGVGFGGFQSNGGTFTPPARGTPGAFGNGGTPRAGGRQGFSDFLPPSVVNGIVQFLQKKAGS